MEQDFITIAEQHLVSFEKTVQEVKKKHKLVKSNSKVALIFIDTDAVATCLWHEVLLGNKAPPLVDKLSRQQPYDFYLIQDPEVPYEPDPQRFIPDINERRNFHQKLLVAMKERDLTNFVILDGTLEQRKQKAISEIDKRINLF